MSQFPDEDPKLSAFLRQYRPIPPETPNYLEARLMESLPTRRSQHTHFRWTIPAIAATLLLAWTSYRHFQPGWRYGAITQELETFLIDNWDETLEMELMATEW
ncbi:hypothetical protein [Gloeocapsa sp. PCC 73106]|uniref:hypothetical protein n=1 Tax=Gloeocapsa sp. PCC 73106 TaxID=102232 RepID=UPI0002ACE759|nr:hypothetical protein [Gloeocapsa sp. PCC 73106]ELR98848.1 hypothetical protein GLO73106DRAFT_00026860 [Gloeocapsa sp. PCC 73106]